MKKILGLLVTALMLTASALAADLDTPQIGSGGLRAGGSGRLGSCCMKRPMGGAKR